jgi:hypothetical protein
MMDRFTGHPLAGMETGLAPRAPTASSAALLPSRIDIIGFGVNVLEPRTGSPADTHQQAGALPSV